MGCMLMEKGLGKQYFKERCGSEASGEWGRFFTPRRYYVSLKNASKFEKTWRRTIVLAYKGHKPVNRPKASNSFLGNKRMKNNEKQKK